MAQKIKTFNFGAVVKQVFGFYHRAEIKFLHEGMTIKDLSFKCGNKFYFNDSEDLKARQLFLTANICCKMLIKCLLTLMTKSISTKRKMNEINFKLNDLK